MKPRKRVRNVVFVRENGVDVIVGIRSGVISAERQLVIGAAHFAHIALRSERQRRDRHASLLSQLHDRYALLLILFRERVFERRAGIAERFAPDALRAVEMAERNIVKTVEHRGIHVVRAADRDIL